MTHHTTIHTTGDPCGVAELKRGLMITCTEPLRSGQDDS